mgnify:FL=1
MSRPLKSIDGATSATVGQSLDIVPGGCTSMFVVAENLDPANDTLSVTIEVGVDEYWSPFQIPPEQQGNQPIEFEISEAGFSQFEAENPYTAHLAIMSCPLKKVRPRIVELDDNANNDLSVTVFLNTTRRNTKVIE